jgi:hypothetical protein
MHSDFLGNGKIVTVDEYNSEYGVSLYQKKGHVKTIPINFFSDYAWKI